MKKEEYVLLYEKCAAGNCTEKERKLLEKYKDDFYLNDIPWDEINFGNKQVVTERIYSRLQESIYKKNRLRWLSAYKFPAAAAIVLIILSSGLYYLNNYDKPSVISESRHLKNDIAPGNNKAVLTLGNGSHIILDNLKSGELARQENVIIRKDKDGQLIYDLSKSSFQPNTSQAIIYNSISTPRGGEYQLILPDGTKVWLNAESSLRFPVIFTGKARKVELSGEAYLEVAKNKQMPFRVFSRGVEVEVLGTHFNVNAYQNRSGVTTTLLEGSVRLIKDGERVVLKPGQSGISSEHSAFIVQDVDVEEVTAWKNGYFVFQDENISSIMAKAARWYDVEVEYRGNMADKNFWGKVSRYDNISELLKNMELTGTIHFKIEGRRVIVMP